MKTIVILAHPNIEQSHVNKVWSEALVKSNPEITVHNIYKTYPDGKIDVVAEQLLLEESDRIIFQYPFFWYNMPPLLKKWFDDVFAMGWAYGENGNKLAGKEIGIAVSTAGLEEVYDEKTNIYGTIEELLKPLESTVKFVKGKFISYHTFHGAYTLDASERLLENTKQYIKFVTQE